MTSAGILITAIIIWFEIVIFACHMELPVTGVFYLDWTHYSAQFYPEKISEGE
jgi:hypothetical protein